LRRRVLLDMKTRVHADDEDFDNWCAENEMSPDDEDSRGEYQDYLLWCNNPYLYNGLNERDFL